MGLHGIGKLTELWQGNQWANASDELLAHFPYRKINPGIFHGKNHAVISAYLLRKQCNRILFNVVLQHHKRYIYDNSKGTSVEITRYKMHKDYKKCLAEYVVCFQIEEEVKSKRISYKDIIDPSEDIWNEFLYLVGTLMEVETKYIPKKN
jgi:CRISPR-associated endonuclease/helicase Cas3